MTSSSSSSRTAPWRVVLALFALCLAARGEEAGDETACALFFGAPGGTVSVPHPALPSDAAGFSVELRFKTLAKLSGLVPVVSCWAPASPESDRGTFNLSLGASDIALDLLGTSGKVKTVRAHGSWKEGVWHHLVATWDGQEAALHMDGKRVGGGKLDDIGALATSSLPIVIGALPDPKNKSRGCFEGFLSDVAIWGSVRGVDAGARIARSETGLVAWYPLRERAPSLTVKGTPGGDGELSPALARIGWCRTPWWFDTPPDRPWLHLFSYDLSSETGRAGRRILVTNPSREEVGLLWQEGRSGRVHLTWVSAALDAHRTVKLEGMEGGTLAAGTADPRGSIYYMMIEAPPREDPEGDESLGAALYLASVEGKPLRDAAVDTSQEALNVTDYGGRWVGSMAWTKEALCVIIPRRMHRSRDGLQHQGGIAATFAPDLSRFQVLGQTSGHSFGNLLTTDSRGEFVGLDLGDNFPRGLNLHRIGRGSLSSSVVFTYKTEHAGYPANDSPEYVEISGKGRTFYKWSNDNNTYSELGGVVEGKTCFVVVFATDRSPEGKVLDCSRVGVPNEPRDLAMLRVVKSFGRGGGPQVSDALMVGLPKGAAAETGGYYDFTGNWVAQRVTGVTWLTKHAPGEGAHAPQLARRRDGTLLVLWERSGPGGPSLRATTVDESGKRLAEVDGLASRLQLVPEGVPVKVGPRIFALAIDGSGGARLCFVRDE